MSTIVTRGFGQTKQGIITLGYGRTLEDIIVEAIEEITAKKRKGRSRASRQRRDKERNIEHYVLEVSLTRVNNIEIDEAIKNKILESIEKNKTLRTKVTSIDVQSKHQKNETKVTVTAILKK